MTVDNFETQDWNSIEFFSLEIRKPAIFMYILAFF